MKSNTTIVESLSGVYDERYMEDEQIPMKGVVLSHVSNPPGLEFEVYYRTAKVAMRSVTDKDARKELRKQLAESPNFIQLSADMTPAGSSGLLWWGIRDARYDRTLDPR